MKQLNNKLLFKWLVIAFFLLYAMVAFVSTLHAISFFQLTNAFWLALILALAFEVGQASVLFDILTSKSKRLLPWLMMIVLTAVQVIGNVYASFKFMDSSGSNDWTYWQRSILFWLEADGPEMFKVVISWIAGALLPLIALGMTSLVADKLNHGVEGPAAKVDDEPDPEPEDTVEEDDEEVEVPEELLKAKEEYDEVTSPEMEEFLDLQDQMVAQSEKDVKEEKIVFNEHPRMTIEDLKRITEEDVPDDEETIKAKLEKERKEKFAEELIKDAEESKKVKKEPIETNIKEIPFEIITNPAGINTAEVIKKEFVTQPYTEDGEPAQEFITPLDPNTGNVEENLKEPVSDKKPEFKPRGWHFKKEHVDFNGDVYKYGIHQEGEKRTPPKKA